MSDDFMFDRYTRIKKKSQFRIFIIGIILICCLNLYLVISGVTKTYNWTIEKLTTTNEGLIIQIIELVAFLSGVIFFIEMVVLIILYLKSP